MTRRISISSQRPSFFQSLTAAVVLLFFAGRAHGQEALRMSLAGDVAAESRQQAESTIGYYNVLMGPVAWLFSSGLEMAYNDNVSLQSQNREGDFIIRPNLNTQIHWPVSQKNSLDVSLGAGYSFYATHTELDRLFVNPGSGISFDIFIGDCVVNLHDRISITENTYQNPTAGNQNFAQLENTAGVGTTWDLNQLLIQLGYDHVNDISLGSSQQTPNASSENWFLNAGAHCLPQVIAGVEGGVGLVTYGHEGQSSLNQPDATQLNAGLFCKVQISEHINGRLDTGYTVYTPSATGGFTNLSSAASLYFQLSLSHQVNRFINYSLSAGRSTQSSVFGQPYDFYFASFQPSWNFFRKYQLSTPLFWQRGSQLANQLYGRQFGIGNYNQYGAGIILGHGITQKLTGTLAYQFVRLNSSQSSNNYTENIVSLSFSYRF